MGRVIVTKLYITPVDIRLNAHFVSFSDLSVLNSRIGNPPLFMLPFFGVPSLSKVVAQTAVFLDNYSSISDFLIMYRLLRAAHLLSIIAQN